MIDLILSTILYWLQSILSLFPIGTGFPSSFHTAVSALGGYFHILDPLVPIDILLACVTFIFGVELALFGFRTLKWLISFIPWFGGKGV